MAKKIWITYVDRERLQARIDRLGAASDHREQAHLQELARELEGAEVFCDSDQVPPDLITMRSRVQLKNLTTGSELQCVLVYPDESNPDENSISVLAPLGTAMLGHRTGDTFDVRLPKGVNQFQVDAITYQPEAAGDFHL